MGFIVHNQIVKMLFKFIIITLINTEQDTQMVSPFAVQDYNCSTYAKSEVLNLRAVIYSIIDFSKLI